MADFEHKINTGSLFKNQYKDKVDKPDYKGKINVGGRLLDIAAWIKEGKNGKFFSLKVNEPFQRRDVTEPKNEPQTLGDILDDPIPF